MEKWILKTAKFLGVAQKSVQCIGLKFLGTVIRAMPFQYLELIFL